MCAHVSVPNKEEASQAWKGRKIYGKLPETEINSCSIRSYLKVNHSVDVNNYKIIRAKRRF